MLMKHYAPNRCEPSIEALNFGGGGRRGDQGRCERRSEVLVKFKNTTTFFLVEGRVRGRGGGGVGGGAVSGPM